MPENSGNPGTAEPLGPDAASRILTMLQSEDGYEASAPEAGDFPAIDGFRIIRRLGAGGGGVVFLAYRDGSDRPVALKLLHRTFSTRSQDTARSWRELEILSQIRLPAVPRIIDYGHHGGSLFIATEFIEGSPLTEYCRQQKLDRRRLAALLARIADAMHSLHELGVMHRDIKPANILVTPHGDPVLIDLGIAALLHDDLMQTLTGDGAPIGSPAFMAPEQAAGDRAAMSTRTDVYGLGATACYVVSGQTPFDTGTTLHAAIERITHEEPRHPLSLDPGIPRPLAAIIAKAASRRPEDRYDSAAALAADLRRWLIGEPITAAPPSCWIRAMRWIAMRPVVTTAVVCVSMGGSILGASFGSVWWVSNRPNRVEIEQDASFAYLRAGTGRELARWGTGERNSVIFARRVPRAREFGGGQIVFIVANGLSERGGTDSQLSAYEAHDLKTPLWSTPLGAPDLKAPPESIWSDDYQVTHVMIANIFEESAGDEIVVVHSHFCCSPRAIRIYNFSGEVLYETWHLGQIDSLQWITESRLLALSGHRHGKLWIEHLYDFGERSWPNIVFAIRPELGKQYSDGWINVLDPWPQSKPDVAWYRYIMPFDRMATSTVLTRSDVREHPDAVRLHLNLGNHVGYSVSWLLDSAGDLVPGTEVVSDPYSRMLAAERPPDRYFLADAIDVCGLQIPRGGGNPGAEKR